MAYRAGRLGLLIGLTLCFGVMAVLAQGEATSTPTLIPGTLLNPALLQDTSLLTDEPCAAPCWRGITPGETSWDEALAILQADPTLANVQVQDDANSESRFASWGQAGGERCCQIFSLDGETISILYLQVAPDVMLADLIDIQGEPTYAIAAPASNDQALINLIYPEQQIIVSVYVEGTMGSLSATSEVVSFLLMDQIEVDQLLGTASLNEWHGYDDYAAYSFDASTALEITPDATVTPTGG